MLTCGVPQNSWLIKSLIISRVSAWLKLNFREFQQHASSTLWCRTCVYNYCWNCHHFLPNYCHQILEEYNDNHTPMNLVLFDDALDHLTRVHRVIRMDQGHALLVGVGESKIHFYDHQKYVVAEKRNPPFLRLKIITRYLCGKTFEIQCSNKLYWRGSCKGCWWVLCFLM